MPEEAPKNKTTMKAKKIIYVIGAVICSALTIICRSAAMPLAMAYNALDAMAGTSEETNRSLWARIRR